MGNQKLKIENEKVQGIKKVQSIEKYQLHLYFLTQSLLNTHSSSLITVQLSFHKQ